MVHKPVVADVVIDKPLVVDVDRRLQAFGGYIRSLQAFGDRCSLLQAFGGLRGSPFTSLRWQVDSFTSLSWHTWIVVYKPLVVYVDRRVQCFWWRAWIVV